MTDKGKNNIGLPSFLRNNKNLTLKTGCSYANNVIQQIIGTMINVDGSIHQPHIKNKPNCEHGYGGYGIIITNATTKQTIKKQNGTIDTNDPQLAELAGIRAN